VENNNPSLFAAAALESAADLALALAPQAGSGHFDELRGAVSERPAAMPKLLSGTPPNPLPGPIGLAGQSQTQSQGQSQSQGPSQSIESSASTVPEAPAQLAPAWHAFFTQLGTTGFSDLNHRNANLQRLIRDNGVTYNVYADADGPQRPWALDLFPMLLTPQDWASIEAGVAQRARLLDRIMADVYGAQTLPKLGLLPTALIQGHPGYLRPMHGSQPAGGKFLHIAAFDLARGPDGNWWVVSQRTQAPSGLGYLLENRLSISMQFPEAFREMNVQRLAASYRALVDGMKAACPMQGQNNISSGEARIVLLTPGPYNETYFEHAYLARYLGLTLVEGSDLMVRDDRLFLKTLQGLEPVHGILKRLDDEFLDPLELRSDSSLGVPGLLQVIRAGNVLVANAPGSAFLESPALLGFLPALSEHLLGEKLAMPSLATWWCGEQAALQSVLPQLKDCVIKPTFPASGLPTVIGQTLSRAKLDEWAGRMMRHGEDYTVQAYLPLSQTPTWQGEKIAPRSAMLRVFAVSDGHNAWQVLPGGLARLAGKNENIASMQYGGSSADVWALGAAHPSRGIESHDAAAAAQTPFAATATSASTAPPPPLRHKRAVTSRAAENLFWLGRYTERAENSVRLAHLTLQSLSGEEQSSQPLLAWLSAMAVNNALVVPKVPPATQAKRVFERSLIANLADMTQAASVGYSLHALKNAASAVRERLSQEQWKTIVHAEAEFFIRCKKISSTPQKGTQGAAYSTQEALRALDGASAFLAAMTGAQTDRMMRDDGWRLLSIGRHIERLNMLASALMLGFETGAAQDDSGFAAIVALFDSTITFHAQYQQRRDIVALLDLLVLDRDNPRSIAWVAQTLRARLAKLEGTDLGQMAALAMNLPDPGSWTLADLYGASDNPSDSTAPQTHARLQRQLERCAVSALELSDLISRRYFSHAASGSHSLGA
jgi:uncharacterized circularly permuted ATP-grasp superfamily protein/uncharacterized alpha-E superfamily protein